MKDYAHDSLSSILPTRTNNNSGSPHAPEHIGPQVHSSYSTVRNGLDRRPIFGGDQGLVAKPLGNGLLADSRTVHELGNTFSERCLGARDLDGPLQSDNVVFLHTRRRYTTIVVGVNNNRGMPPKKRRGTVIAMPRVQHKVVVKPPIEGDELQARRGPDGLTLGERIELCMKNKSRKIGRPYLQKDLLADANRAAGRGPNDPPVISQQGLSLIMRGRRSESTATPALAAALEVEGVWLQFGYGPASYLEALVRQK